MTNNDELTNLRKKIRETLDAMQLLGAELNMDVFSSDDAFCASLSDVCGDNVTMEAIKNILRITVCDERAYERLKKSYKLGNILAPALISKEISEVYMIDKRVIDVTIESIAEIIGFKKILQKKSIISFGRYDWFVLDVQEDKALLISDKIIKYNAYHNVATEVTWEKCKLRTILNSDFYNEFEPKDRQKIAEVSVQNNRNPWFGTDGGNDTHDKIFLLSIEEIIKYFGDSGGISDSNRNEYWIDDNFSVERIAYTTKGTPAWWWLRSPGDGKDGAAGIDRGGEIHIKGDFVDFDEGGIRPAFWLLL